MQFLPIPFLMLAVTLVAAQGPIRLPVEPAPPVVPVPADAPVKMSADSLYVIDSDLPLAVLSSPSGILSVTADEGPLKIKGRFSPGGKVETKTFKGKHVYTVEVIQQGQCELILVPLGLKNQSEVIRRRVDAGTAPKPPPDPTPNPPTPDPDVTPSKMIVLVVEATDAAAATRGALFADAALASRMAEKGHRWRVISQNVVGPDGQPPADVLRFLNSAKGKNIPQVFVVDEMGRTRIQADLPVKAADLLTMLKKFGG